MAACPQWHRLWQHPSLGPAFCSLAPGCRRRRGGKKLLLVDFTAVMRLLLYFFFCSVIALDEMGFIPGNRKDILVPSWFQEVWGLQSSWRGGWGITCCGFLTLVVCPSPSHQHLLVKAALTQDNKPALWGLFSCRDFNPCWELLVESVCVTVW